MLVINLSSFSKYVATKCRSITSHLCCWNLGSFLLAPRGSVRALALREEVSKMFLKGDLGPVNQPSLGFYSWLILVEKVTGGGGRPVTGLSTFNGFITLTKFQMETIASLLGSIRKGDWMFSIDLRDAYVQIPFHPESQPNLRLCLEGSVYQFCALYFGLSTALQVFTRVFALVSEWAHQGACAPFVTDVSLSHSGAHLLDLTASLVWPRKRVCCTSTCWR